ncbi:MAG: hypothetical protein COW00_18150 [Bdellovibrio sp. CG12_big_fil_rev_8_21_14_0_65_39_13]|nr:MAG: hypothetical protein COW78_06020 [Bdellovibrio sp. CG22_combo_CG10-13_8_21_14_all_39_27]PIQ58032.1 MAG: hypothetical protein COW00_18150 [Bdellovibrio sp. CG12_big_fil_rev_8_21_14_0_65_39_13]PIR36942.1 MAG: hypothetical protein COV37_00180 [Bdellovibrio sp. CG11_big_fil_rev_8_21_14_0_20_39_38]PJB52368.1 MAG: hypothetical protein CO099_12955 [Bdellovibrio sp. CG_4_9_14_3_um_filter_39_7]
MVLRRSFLLFSFIISFSAGCVTDGDQMGNDYAALAAQSTASPRIQGELDNLTKNGTTFPSSDEVVRAIDPQRDICKTCSELHPPAASDAEAVAAKINTPVCTHFNKFKSAGVPEKPLKQALFFYNKNKGDLNKQRYVSIADYSQRSNQKRFYILDMQTGQVRKEKVSHGSGDKNGTKSGDLDHDGMIDKCHHGNNITSRENMTRAGFFMTKELYKSKKHERMKSVNGKQVREWPYLDSNKNNGLRMVGLSPEVNDEALAQGVVMHGAWYNDVSDIMGRSYGCPAFESDIAPSVIDTLRGGSLYYSYTPRCEILQSKVEKQIKGWQGMCAS